MTLLGVIIASVTFAVTLLSFYLAFRAEMRKNNEKLIEAKIIDERRHASHELRLSILEERLALIESSITFRLDEINKVVSSLNDLLINHLTESNYE